MGQINEVLPSYQITDVAEALKSAFEILKDSRNLNQEIYLISDLGRTGWYFADRDFSPPEESKAKLYVLDVWPEDRQNLCIEELDFGNQLIEKNRPFQIKAQVANFTSGSAKNLLVGLYLDGRRVSQTDIDVERGGKTTVEFVPTVESAGTHTGFFEITDDDLMIDNRRYFAFKIPERIEVLLVGEHRIDTRHLGLALNPLQKSDIHMAVSEADRKSLAGIDFNKYQAVIFSNLSKLSEVDMSNLERFIRRGGGVLFILGNNVDAEFYSEEIGKRFFDLDSGLPFTATKNVGGFFTLEKTDWDHPIFQVYQKVEQDRLPQIKFSSIFELPQGKNVRVISRFNLGKPALIEKNLGSGKVLLFATSLDKKETDLVAHPFFVPFANRTVEYLASDLSRLSEDFLVGSRIERELDPSLSSEELKLTDPENLETSLAPIIQKDKLMLRISEAEKPGIYKIKTGIKEADRFAVNVNSRDSDPQKIGEDEIEKKLEGLSLFHIHPDDDVEKAILQSRFGKELWKPFLWIAFGLLALEMYLARSRKKDIVSEEKT